MDITNLLIIIVGDYFLLNQNYRMLLTLMIPWVLSKIQTTELDFIFSSFYSNDKKYCFHIYESTNPVRLKDKLRIFLNDYFTNNLSKIYINKIIDVNSPEDFSASLDTDYKIDYKNVSMIVRKCLENKDTTYYKIWCSDITIMYDFINYLEKYEKTIKKSSIDQEKNKILDIYYVTDNGTWLMSSLDSSIKYTPFLDKKVLTSLYQDIDTFHSSKQEYLDNQKSYKRTYLFEGLPGTGKTNLIKHLAIKYKRNILYMKMESFTDGIRFCSKILDHYSKNSIIVLEDFACKEEQPIEFGKPKPGLSKKDLINIFDGMMCPFNNHIIIMTTNYVENIDPVLIRPGRIDYRINFTYATREQIQQIIDKKQLEFPEKIINKYTGKATIAEIFNKIETNTFV